MAGLNNYIKEDYDNVQKLLDTIIGIKNCHRSILESSIKHWFGDEIPDMHDPVLDIMMNYEEWEYMSARMKSLYDQFVEVLEDIELEGFKPTDENHYTSKELKGEYSRWGC